MGERIFQKNRLLEGLEVWVDSGEFSELLVVQHGWSLGSGWRAEKEIEVERRVSKAT